MGAGEAARVSPFVAGLDDYMNRYDRLNKNAASWRRISFILSVLCAICVIWVVFTAGRAQVVPFIVEVDRHGYEIAIKPVAPSGIDDRLIISRLGRFITSLKTILNDDTAQVTYINFVYNSVPSTSAAYKKIADFYYKNNPMHIASSEKTVVMVKLKSILPLGESGKTWRGEWEELRMSDGVLISTKSFTGIFEIATSPATKMQDILENPLGLFVTDFNMTEELQKTK